jgi:protein-L-isoaspartate(D-aspartate) O-methyltransferase
MAGRGGAGDGPSDDDRDRVARAGFTLGLRRHGIRDLRVLSAMEQVPRKLFLPAHLHADAYVDRALPIECGQTISQPSLVALMTEALGVQPGDRVLEIGTGSGYQAAVLSRLCREVFTIERFRSLLTLAEERFATMRLDNVSTKLDDGALGWPEKAPFDRIVVTAAAPELPAALVEQLKVGGVMVVPVGPASSVQTLFKVVRTADSFTATPLCDVRFVPMVAGVASRL